MAMTVPPAPSTTVTPSATGSTSPGTPVSTTSTPTTAQGVPAYQIVLRRQSAGGDAVVVLIEPGTYTDLDLQNIVDDARTRFAPIATLYLVDDARAAPMVIADGDMSAEAKDFLADHYFLVLEDGFRVTYLGPFADFGEVVLGS